MATNHQAPSCKPSACYSWAASQALELLAYFTYCAPAITPRLWSLWPQLATCLNDWAVSLEFHFHRYCWASVAAWRPAQGSLPRARHMPASNLPRR